MKKSKTIFLASRFNEFKELRELIAKEIKLLQETARDVRLIDLNDGNADSINAVQRSLKYVREADLVILLLGDMYGGIPANYEKSYTHLEYEEAINSGKEILVYCIGDSYENPMNLLYSEDKLFHGWQKHILDNFVSAMKAKDYDKVKLAQEIRNSVAKVIEEESSHKIFYDESITNNMSKLKNRSLIPREQELIKLSEFYMHNKEKSALSFVVGNAGIGKSSFLVDFYYHIEESMHSFIYFLGDAIIDDSENLNSLYIHLLNRFKYIYRVEKKYLQRLGTISDNLNVSDKINKLFTIYSQYYETMTIPFILIIDSVDGFSNEVLSLKKIIHPSKGINFLFSARTNTSVEFLGKQEQEYSFFTQYIENQEKVFRLNNIVQNHIVEIISLKLKRYESFSTKQQKEIHKLFIQKSGGLPLYLDYQIEALNKKLETSTDIFLDTLVYMENLPTELNTFYNIIFKNLDAISLEVLQVLYWAQKPMKKSSLLTILDIDSTIYADIENNISHLIIKDNETSTFHISHLSIKEALFNYYKYNEKGDINAIQIDRSFVSNSLKNEDSLFSEVTKYSNYLNNFSKMTYYEKENNLFETLDKLVKYYLFVENIDHNLVNLFYEYSKIVYLQSNLTTKSLLNSQVKFSNTFDNFNVSPFLKDISNKFFSYALSQIPEDVYVLKKLMQIAILVENEYFTAKYIKKLHEYRYYKILSVAQKEEVLNEQNYNTLETILLKSYVTKQRVLENKAYSDTLELYDDGNITLYILKRKKEWSQEKSLILMIKSKIKNPQVYNQYFKIYQAISNTKNVKLLKEFSQQLNQQLYFYKKKGVKVNEKLSTLNENAKILLLVHTIDSFNKNDTNYKYLSVKSKERFNTIKQLYLSYLKNGIESLLKQNSLKYYEYFVIFIKDEDKIKLFEYISKSELGKDSEYMTTLITHINSHEILKYFKTTIQNQDYKTDKRLLIALVNIYYKLHDIEALKSLKKSIINIESIQKERSLLMGIASTVSTGVVDIYKQMLNSNAIVKHLVHGNISMDEFFEILKISEEFGNERFIPLAIEKYFESINGEIIRKKEILMKYKKYLPQKLINFQYLNIVFEENSELFFDTIQNKMTISEQFEYLINNSIYLIHKENQKEAIESLWHYIFELYQNENYDSQFEILIEKVYFRKEFLFFCKMNREKLENFYDRVKTKSILLRHYLYVVLVATDDEANFIQIFNEKWFDFSLHDNLFMPLVFSANKSSTISELINFISENKILTRGKIYLYAGATLENQKFLLEGLSIANNVSNAKKNLNNVVQYSLKKSIKNEAIIDLLAILIIPNYKSKFEVKKFLDLVNLDIMEDSFTDYDMITNPNLFFEYYYSYFVKNSLLIKDDFENLEENRYIEYLLILLDTYKTAEQEDDEKTYQYCEMLFEDIKNNIDNRFESLENISLDNLFDNYKLLDLKELTPALSLDVSLLEKGYPYFYDKLENLYKTYKNAKEELNESLVEEIEQKFQKFKEQISMSEESMQIIKDNTLVKSKLQIKLSNFDKFKMK